MMQSPLKPAETTTKVRIGRLFLFREKFKLMDFLKEFKLTKANHRQEWAGGGVVQQKD